MPTGNNQGFIFELVPPTSAGLRSLALSLNGEAVMRANGMNVSELRIWASSRSTETVDELIDKLITLRESVKPGGITTLQSVAKHFANRRLGRDIVEHAVDAKVTLEQPPFQSAPVDKKPYDRYGAVRGLTASAPKFEAETPKNLPLSEAARDAAIELRGVVGSFSAGRYEEQRGANQRDPFGHLRYCFDKLAAALGLAV